MSSPVRLQRRYAKRQERKCLTTALADCQELIITWSTMTPTVETLDLVLARANQIYPGHDFLGSFHTNVTNLEGFAVVLKDALISFSTLLNRRGP